VYNYIGVGLNFEIRGNGEMEFGEMKRNTSNWSNFCMLLCRAGLTASAGLSCLKQSSSAFAVPRSHMC